MESYITDNSKQEVEEYTIHRVLKAKYFAKIVISVLTFIHVHVLLHYMQLCVTMCI